jgi:hypothetical protein
MTGDYAMRQSTDFSTSDSRHCPDPNIDAIGGLGGEPLAGSGFEAEEPEPNFDERK